MKSAFPGASKKPTEAPGKFELTLALDKRRVADLLCEALDAGAGCWCRMADTIAPPRDKLVVHLGEHYAHVDYPLSEGGALVLTVRLEEPSPEYRLDWEAIQKGLAVMASKYPRPFGDWLAEKDDAETGDVFLQCCLFGEVRYG